MNFLELINKCLVELNYKPVNSFSELTKNEHKKIINILNLLNSEVCQYAKWNFLLRKATLELPSGMKEVENTIHGRISQLQIDSIEFSYCENAADILAGKFNDRNFYSLFDDKIIFSKSFDEKKTVEIVYYTFNNAMDSEGSEKDTLSGSTDESLIPMPYLEPVLVYGTCMRLKGNPQHIRFNYWLSMYKDALANMVSRCSIEADSYPFVKMLRR